VVCPQFYMPDPELLCWKCGIPFGDIPLPLSRFAECKSCGAKLHVCRQCEYYDTSVANHCRETIAEEVKDKTRANFCDYFRAKPGAFRITDGGAAASAAAELESLFGLATGSAPKPPSADASREELDRLFGSGEKK
jgi:hypothetical protein